MNDSARPLWLWRLADESRRALLRLTCCAAQIERFANSFTKDERRPATAEMGRLLSASPVMSDCRYFFGSGQRQSSCVTMASKRGCCSAVSKARI